MTDEVVFVVVSSVVKNVMQGIFDLKFLVLEKKCIRAKINIYKIARISKEKSCCDPDRKGGEIFLLYEIVDDNFLCEKCFKYDSKQSGKIVLEIYTAVNYRYYCQKCVEK